MGGDAKKLGQQLESNVSRNLQGRAADFDRIINGDFNNVYGSMQRFVLSAGTGNLANPDDLAKITGETGSERAGREAVEAEAATAAADVAAREDERRQQIIRRISAEVESRRMTPGTSLLTTGSLAQQSAGNTILTARR